MAPLLFEESIVFPFKDKLLRNISLGTVKNKFNGSDKSSIGNKSTIKVENEKDDYNPQDFLSRSVHLCNKCWSTFVGLNSYFAHRHEGCEHSQVFIEESQTSNRELDSAHTKSNYTDQQNDTPNNDIQCSRDIKLELFDTEEIQKMQESTNNIETQKDRENLSSTMLSKYRQDQITNKDSQEKSYLNEGTCYINPEFETARQTIQWMYEHRKKQFEKESTNNIETQKERESLSSTMLSKHRPHQITNKDLQEKSYLNEGTCYINPDFETARETIRWMYKHSKQVEKVSQTEENYQESDCSKKRNMNVLSPEQMRTSLNTQPTKKIKLSSSSKELSRALGELLRKQMIEVNKEKKLKQNLLNCSNSNAPTNESIGIKLSESMKSSKELDAALQKQMQDLNNSDNISNVNSPEATTSSKSNENKDSDNLNLFQKSVTQISFSNKYSEAFKSRPEIPKNYIKHTSKKNNSSECIFTDSDENSNNYIKEKIISKLDSKFTSKSFEYKRKTETFYKSSNPTRQRKSKFRSNTLVVYNLNINTKTEWLRAVFQRYGNVRALNIRRYLSIKRAKCVVEFEKLSDAEKTYQLCRNRIIDGAMIKLYFYHYSVNSTPNCLGSGTAEFGSDYEARVTGKPSRHDNYSRYQRAGPYNLFS